MDTKQKVYLPPVNKIATATKELHKYRKRKRKNRETKTKIPGEVP